MPKFNGYFIDPSTIPVPPLPDASDTTKGVIRLGGDLSGDANNPTVPGLSTKINKTGDFVSGTYVFNGVPTAPYTLARTTITSNDARIYLENATSDSDKALEIVPGIFTIGTNYASGSDYTYTTTQISSAGYYFDYSFSSGGIARSGAIVLSTAGSSIEVDGAPYIATQGKNIATKQYVDNTLSLKANLASPTFTGTPAAPTATAGTNTTQIATTAFVTTGLNTKLSRTGGSLTGFYSYGITAPSGYESKSLSISSGNDFTASAVKIVGTYVDPLLGPTNITESYTTYHEAETGMRLLKTYTGNPDSPIEMFNYTQLTSDYFSMSYFQIDASSNTTEFTVSFGIGGFNLTKNSSAYLATAPGDIVTNQYLTNTLSTYATQAYVNTAVANNQSFIPANDFYSRRSLQPVISTNTLFSSGFGASATTWSNSSGNITSTIPTSTGVRTKQIRVKLAASSTAGSSLSIGSLLPTPLGFLGGGFLFSFGFSTSSESTPNLTTKCFLGLCNGGPPTITANPSSLTNIIGIGNDSNNDGTIRDANLQIMYNDASGTATKVDLGANFPANGSGTQDWFIAQFYNATGSSSVKYKITNLLNNATAQGTLTTNLPAITVGLGFAFVRTSGTTAIAHAIEFGEITWQSNG